MSTLRPVNYRIRLEPDLGHFKFSGRVEILVLADGPVRDVCLHALDLAVWRCGARIDGAFQPCSFAVDPKREELRISLPGDMEGEIALAVDYVGEINNKMAGLYRSKYVIRGQEKYAAVTQFEESDARRAFPCFDHPAKKATFDVEVVVDEHLAAVSNGPVVEEEALGAGKKRVRFQQTPKMSTYLLFIGIGEFEFIEDPGDVLVRVATMPGMGPRGRYSLEFSRKCLIYSQDYYGIKYPLPKLDLIAVSDFAAGAMENWGAITFRENLLLHDPETTSAAGEERICVVIAHEIAHQWFGNLVTPDDWKYLWLNESFATFFGYGVVHHYHPEWELWEQFLHGQTEVALERDALHPTIPIEIPGGEHVVINVSTAPIIYNKGGSILRQVEGYVGAGKFKEGLRVYLKRHEYACAASHHLWEALEEVSSKPVSKMMKKWVEQAGFPIVDVRREGNRLMVTQERFSYLPDDSPQQWLIPVSVRVFFDHGDPQVLHALLETKDAVINIDPGAVAYKVNDGQKGFYRVRYDDPANLEELGKRIARKTLEPEDRWGIQSDLYALVKKGDASIDAYLQYLVHYSEEDAFLPLSSIAANLHHAYLVGEKKRDKVAAFAKSFLERILASIGYEPKPGERHTTSILRDQVMYHAVLYGSKDVSAFALSRFSSLIRGEKVHPDIMKSVMQVGALHGGEEALDWFSKKMKTSESEHERMNVLVALGCFRERDLIERAQEYILDEVPDRNKFIPISVLSENPNAMPLMWDWYISNLQRFEQFHPIHYERVITSIVPLCGLGREREVRSFFEAYVTKKEKLSDVVKLCLEKLDINARMREREI
jgi:aminopeptidase N